MRKYGVKLGLGRLAGSFDVELQTNEDGTCDVDFFQNDEYAVGSRMSTEEMRILAIQLETAATVADEIQETNNDTYEDEVDYDDEEEESPCDVRHECVYCDNRRE